MTEFTPLSATIGGALIGTAAVLLMAGLGRITGISGILSGILFGSNNHKLWRVAFIAGLIVAPLLYTLVSGNKPSFTMNAGTIQIIIAGLLVGFGTRLGSGCTSGHGVCGLSRLSPRSLVAVGCFMFFGIATVTVARHLIGA